MTNTEQILHLFMFYLFWTSNAEEDLQKLIVLSLVYNFWTSESGPILCIKINFLYIPSNRAMVLMWT